MQINGMREFLSKFITPSNTVAGSQGNVNPLTLAPSRQKNGFDMLSLSDIGKRLSIKTEKAPTLNAMRQTNNSDPIMNLMDKSMSEVEEILGKMHKLAAAARDDKKLTALDRINMQIEMEDLRHQLSGVSTSMSEKLAKMSGQKTQGKVALLDGVAPGILYGDSSTVLERARERILRGENWDVAEGFEQINVLEKVLLGDRSIDVNEGEYFVLPSDIDPEEIPLVSAVKLLYGKYSVESGNTGEPTVSQKLKETDTIILMDSKSAADGVKRLESEMERVKAMRQEFALFKDKYMAEAGSQKTGVYAPIRQNFSFGTEVITQGNAEEISDNEPEKRNLTFNTELGVMECVGGGNFSPKLVRPSNSKGVMFARLDRFFNSVANNFAKAWLSESVKITSSSWANADPFTNSNKKAA